ncbi:hypothetical protein C5167_050095 [Papaver somniferum]|uniref:Uncharacterized protein n=1 Tax=Papaver somniferum TaxID=3469 RepID=A0A4Y7KP38_PAPSO|nr:hypothetical protein C5167_050095 [Papaver somniferum]
MEGGLIGVHEEKSATIFNLFTRHATVATNNYMKQLQRINPTSQAGLIRLERWRDEVKQTRNKD